MRSRSILLGGAALLLASVLTVLLLAPSLPGQDGGGGKGAKGRPAASAVDRRLAQVEAQLGKLAKEVQGLRAALKAPQARPEKRAELQIFTLKNAQAGEMVKILQTLLEEGNGMRLIADPRTNSVLMRGSAEQLDTARAVLARLDEPVDKEAPPAKTVAPEKKKDEGKK